MQEPIGLVLVGLAAGFTGALAGVGGGFLVVPYLLGFWTREPAMASGSSLVVVTLNVLCTTLARSMRQRIRWTTGLFLGLCTLPGAVLGPGLVRWVPPPAFHYAFAALLVGTGWYVLLFRPEQRSTVPQGRYWLAGAIAAVAGLVASTFGVGGGIFYVPVLILILGVPVLDTVGTSQFAVLLTAAAGAAVYAIHGNVIWDAALWMAPGVIAGGQAGVWAARRARPVWIKLVFVLVCLAVAGWTVVRGTML